MFRISFKAGRGGQNLGFAESGRTDDSCKRRLAVGKRSSLVENKRTTRIDLFEHRCIFDDDATLAGERDRSDDRNWYGNEQRTRCRDHKYGEETPDLTTYRPSHNRNADR